MTTGVVVLVVIAVIALVIWGVVSMVSVLQEYERGVVFRLGRVRGRAKGPGLIILLPFGIDRMRKVTIQTVAMNVPPQDVITKDNVTMRVDAVVYAGAPHSFFDRSFPELEEACRDAWEHLLALTDRVAKP